MVGWPIPAESVLAYCGHMHRLGLAHSTMSSQLAAIMLPAMSEGFRDPCRGFRVRKALEGWAWMEVKRKDSRLPVLPVFVQELREVLPAIFSSMYGLVISSSLLLALFWSI